MNDIAITTVSWIRTDEERNVVLSTIKSLSRLDVPIVIADKGSSEKDIDIIKKTPHVIFFKASGGLTEQLFVSNREAAKVADYLFYLHTDKLDFVQNTTSQMITAYRKLKNKGMLIPVRTKESFQTYPFYQQKQEEFLNFFVGDYVGIPNDYYAGPKIYPSTLIPYLDQAKGDFGWGIEAYFYVIAKRLGLPFDLFPFSMQAPIDVDDEEKTKIYRLNIASWMIDGFLQGQTVKL